MTPQRTLLRDGDLTHAAEPSRAGISVEFHPNPGAPHESDSIASVPGAGVTGAGQL